MKHDVFFYINNKELYLDSYLVDFDIPIFYICKDDENSKYAVMCIDSIKEKYVIGLTTNKDIKAMLLNSLDLCSFINNTSKKWYVICNKEKKSDEVITVQKLNKSDLPKKNAFLELHNKRVIDYVKKIDSEIEEQKEDKIFEGCQEVIYKKFPLNYCNETSSSKSDFNYISDYNSLITTIKNFDIAIPGCINSGRDYYLNTKKYTCFPNIESVHQSKGVLCR